VPLRGSAFVIMWHDIAPDADAAYNRWHTQEHMPERIALPGFLRSRRGLNRALDRQIYFTLYECDDLGSTVSPEYQRSLNFPTEWTQQVAPHFRNFKRMSCETLFTKSRGAGGAIATFRADLPGNIDEAQALSSLTSAVEEIVSIAGVTGVHIGVPRPNFTNGETTEVQIRPAMTEPDFGVVIVVEGIGLAELTAKQPAIEQILARADLSGVNAQSYDMAYMLDIETTA